MKPSAQSDWTLSIRATKQALILDAARAVFEQHGLEGATMREIAAKAGVTTGAIYPLFSSKEAMYAELLRQSLHMLDDAVRQAASRPRKGEQAHEAAARAFLAYYLGRPFEVNLGLYAFQGIKRQGVGRALSTDLDAALVAIVRRLSPRHDEQALGMPDSKAMQLFAFLIGLLTLELSGRLKIGRSNARSLLDLFLRERLDATNP